MDWAKTTARRDENQLNFVIWWIVYLRFYGDCLCYTQIISVCSLYRVNSIVFDVYIMNVYCSFDCAANNISLCDMDKWCIAMGIYDTNIICYLRISLHGTCLGCPVKRHLNIVPENILLSDGTKVLLKPMLTSHWWGFVAFPRMPYHSERPKVYSV